MNWCGSFDGVPRSQNAICSGPVTGNRSGVGVVVDVIGVGAVDAHDVLGDRLARLLVGAANGPGADPAIRCAVGGDLELIVFGRFFRVEIVQAPAQVGDEVDDLHVGFDADNLALPE